MKKRPDFHKLFPIESGSGDTSENEHSISGYELKKNELYVISGDTLITAYKLLLSQRTSALLQINNLPPTYSKEIQSYIGIFTLINKTMYDILNAIQYKTMEKENQFNTKSKRPDIRYADFMEEFLKRNKIRLDGNMNDGKKKDIPPSDSPPEPDDSVH